MTQLRVVRFLGRLTALSGATLLLTGCPEDAADIVKPVATSIDFPVAPSGTGFPTGALTLNRFTLAEFDTSVADAFARKIPGKRSFYSATASQFGSGWNMTGFERSSATDPRLPALVDDDARVVRSGGPNTGLVILDPSGLCNAPCPFHNIFTDGAIQRLKPNTVYIVALFRYGLIINGGLDAGLRALGRPVDTPDQLVPVGGSPKGDPGRAIVTFPTIVTLEPQANPMVLGNFTTDANGVGSFDVVVSGPGLLYRNISGNPPDAAFDSSLVARNDDTPTTFPRYNYLVILEGPAADAADAADNPQALRIQMAQDFVASTGQMVNNGYAPFPTPLTIPQLIAAPGGAGRPDSITVTFQNLESLAGGQWQLWLSNRDESPVTIIPAVGTYEKIQIIREVDPITGEIISERDEIIETVPGTSGFTGEAGLIKHRIVLSDAGRGATDSVGFFTDAFLTLEPQAGATVPSAARVLWFQYTDQKGTPKNFFDDASKSGALLFGTFDPENPAKSRAFGSKDLAQSAGLGGVRDEEVSVEIRNLPRPPVGTFYEGWLVGPDGNAVSMGPITGLPPDTINFFDADVDPPPLGVTATGIRFANARILLSSPADILSREGDQFVVRLDRFFLTLEPKIGAPTKSPTEVMLGPLPIARMTERLRRQE